MAHTIGIVNSDEVMAELQPGEFYRGKWEKVQVTEISDDKDTPLEVRTALVGLTVPTIFTKESIEKQTGARFPVPEGSRFAYCEDVISALKSAGKVKEAEQLRRTSGNSLDMYVFEAGCYKLAS